MTGFLVVVGRVVVVGLLGLAHHGVVVCCCRLVVVVVMGGLFVVVFGVVDGGTHHGDVVVTSLGLGTIVVGGRGPFHQVVFLVVVLVEEVPK